MLSKIIAIIIFSVLSLPICNTANAGDVDISTAVVKPLPPYGAMTDFVMDVYLNDEAGIKRFFDKYAQNAPDYALAFYLAYATQYKAEIVYPQVTVERLHEGTASIRMDYMRDGKKGTALFRFGFVDNKLRGVWPYEFIEPDHTHVGDHK